MTPGSPVLYSSEFNYVASLPADSDTLVITFGHFRFRGDEPNFWSRGLCQRLGVGAIGFVSRCGDWFAPAHTMPAIEAVLPLLGRYKRRILYGGSMGGYAALRYGRLLQADAVIAITPQFSIEERLVGGFDPVSHKFFDPALHAGMELTADIPERSFLFFDPGFSADHGHSQMIMRAAPQARPVPMWHMEHGVARAFTNIRTVRDLLAAAMAGDDWGVRQAAGRARRSSVARTAVLAADAIARHPLWAAEIAVKYDRSLVGDDRDLLWTKLSAQLRQYETLDAVQAGNPHVRRVVDEANRFLASRPHDPRALLRAAGASLRIARDDEAIFIMREVIRSFPAFAPGYSRLAATLAQAGQIPEALNLWRKAVDLDPTDALSMGWLSTHEERLGNLDAAVMWLRRKIAAARPDGSLHDKLAALLLKAGRPAEAFEAARTATTLSPSMPLHWAHLARLASRTGDDAVALEAVQRAVDLDPGNAQYLLLLASQQERGDSLDAAAETLDRLVAGGQESVDVLARAAAVAHKRGRTEEALDFATRLLERDPCHAWASAFVARQSDQAAERPLAADA